LEERCRHGIKGRDIEAEKLKGSSIEKAEKKKWESGRRRCI
jgi:hypothetical protein